MGEVAHLSWRESSLLRIEEIVRTLAPDASEKVARKAFRIGYPFGERKSHPTKGDA